MLLDYRSEQAPKPAVVTPSTRPAQKAVPVFLPSTDDQVMKLLYWCEALRNCPPDKTNDYRVFVGAVFVRLNRPDLVHKHISVYASDYDANKTDYHYRKMVERMPRHEPITCRFAKEHGLCEGLCGTRTPFELLDKRAPVTLDALIRSGEKIDFNKLPRLWDNTRAKQRLKEKLRLQAPDLPLFEGLERQTKLVNQNIDRSIDIIAGLFACNDKTIDKTP